jgi:hypothetical protein
MINLTIEQAAKLLEQTPETMQEWVDKGIVPHKVVNKVILIDSTDLQEVREILDSGKNVSNPFERMAFLEIRLKRMERLVQSLCSICQVPATITLQHLEDKELYKLYSEAFMAMGQDSWGDVEVRKWASIFMQITEVDFDRLANLTENNHPWKIFMSLCHKIIGWWELGTQDSRIPSIMEITYLLDKGRKNLRNSIILYLKETDKSPQRLVERYFDLPPREKIKRFAEKWKK